MEKVCLVTNSIQQCLHRLQIEFKDVKMRYRPGLPLVLKGLDVCIEAGTTCGVVGRTGAQGLVLALEMI